MASTEVRLYFLRVLTLPARVLVYCKTNAPTLEVAEEQATAFYGPLELNSWDRGNRVHEAVERFLLDGTEPPSVYDASVSDQLLEPLCL